MFPRLFLAKKGHKQGLSSPFLSDCPGQAKEDRNCLPLRVGPAWSGQKVVLYASVRETNRRPFGARCGGYPLWIVLDNQHP
ncbi:hypothetical protein, partial [Aneurinibacillus migulanus]